ncbi:MAG: acyl-CoA dehydrogenase family protein [Actinobacteria bacterium]|nr:acyl-CoA dehydrogenase family protein [Actinomycetota bacterium]
MLPDYSEYESAIGLDWYEVDPNLRFTLDRLLPDADDRAFAEELVSQYGDLVGKRIAPRAEVTDKHGPELRRYDAWGQDANEVVHHATWLENKADLRRSGFIAVPTRDGRAVPGPAIAARAYLVCQAEIAIYCALGMTSGAAGIVSLYAPPSVRDDLVSRLTSLDPEQAWEGGMFLTERQGGSDVGANTTRAVQDGDEWRVYGEKFFCSNADAEVFIVLARPDGAPDGVRGLATFIVPRVLPDGRDNHFHIKRLKPKLGTRGVPTAEIEIDGALAWLAGRPDQSETGDAARDGRGINRMMEMVNGSRFGVAVMGLGNHRRSFLESAIYAAQREQFGNRIDSYPLVRETLVDMLVELEGSVAMTFECAAAERASGTADEGRLLRRILVPLAKIRATREAINWSNLALEVLGGNGYMEDWPIARQVRDAHANTIWEGTENILAIDVRRAMKGEAAHEALLARVEQALDAASPHDALARPAESVATGLKEAREAIAHLENTSDDLQSLHSGRFAHLLADVIECALVLDEAAWSLERDGDARKALVARRLADRRLTPPRARGILDDDRAALDLFEPGSRRRSCWPSRSTSGNPSIRTSTGHRRGLRTTGRAASRSSGACTRRRRSISPLACRITSSGSRSRRRCPPGETDRRLPWATTRAPWPRSGTAWSASLPTATPSSRVSCGDGARESSASSPTPPATSTTNPSARRGNRPGAPSRSPRPSSTSSAPDFFASCHDVLWCSTS